MKRTFKVSFLPLLFIAMTPGINFAQQKASSNMEYVQIQNDSAFQAFEKLMLGKDKIYGNKVTLTVVGGATFAGELLTVGTNFVTLRTGTGMMTTDDATKKTRSIQAIQNVALQSIVAISYETLK